MWFCLYEIATMGKFIKTQNRLEVTRSLGREENGNLLLNGYRVSVLGWWKHFGNNVDGCTTLWMPLNCKLKNA